LHRGHREHRARACLCADARAGDDGRPRIGSRSISWRAIGVAYARIGGGSVYLFCMRRQCERVHVRTFGHHASRGTVYLTRDTRSVATVATRRAAPARARPRSPTRAGARGDARARVFRRARRVPVARRDVRARDVRAVDDGRAGAARGSASFARPRRRSSAERRWTRRRATARRRARGRSRGRSRRRARGARRGTRTRARRVEARRAAARGGRRGRG
jgi:hypothetical protein